MGMVNVNCSAVGIDSGGIVVLFDEGDGGIETTG